MPSPFATVRAAARALLLPARAASAARSTERLTFTFDRKESR